MKPITIVTAEEKYISEKEFPEIRIVLPMIPQELLIEGVNWHNADNTGEVQIYTGIYAELENETLNAGIIEGEDKSILLALAKVLKVLFENEDIRFISYK